MKKISAKSLLDGANHFDAFSISRILTWIEAEHPGFEEFINYAWKKQSKKKAPVIGVTGPPGAGKSTLVNELIRQLRIDKKKICVLCVDPSSPFSGGAILGDRIRMFGHGGDESVFIRSFGTRGRSGGLTPAIYNAISFLRVLDFDYVILETVGVGQTEISIMNVADCVVMVVVPESGDEIQVMKAGIMEIADVFCVNKSDRPSADILLKEIDSHLREFKIPKTVIATNALTAKGIKELLVEITEVVKKNFNQRDEEKWNHHVREILKEQLDDKINQLIIAQVTDTKENPIEFVKKILSKIKIS